MAQIIGVDIENTDDLLQYTGNTPQLIKKGSKRLSIISPFEEPNGTKLFSVDMDGYESFTIAISGGGQTGKIEVRSGDSPASMTGMTLTCVNIGYAGHVSSVINAVNAPTFFRANKIGRFLDVVKNVTPNSAIGYYVVTLILHQETYIPTPCDISYKNKPTTWLKYASTLAIANTSEIDLFPDASANQGAIANLVEIKASNSGTVVAELQVITNSVVVYRMLIPPGVSVKEQFEIPLTAPGNQKFSIKLASQTNTAVFVYAFGYRSLV